VLAEETCDDFAKVVVSRRERQRRKWWKTDSESSCDGGERGVGVGDFEFELGEWVSGLGAMCLEDGDCTRQRRRQTYWRRMT
jgi:hypothetical protein